MRVKRFTIKNFKSISTAGVNIDFRDRLCVLVGKNNAGKTNILEAFGMVFGTKNPRYVRIEPSSYNDPTQAIIIEAVLEGLDWGAGKSIGLSEQQCGCLMHAGKRVKTEPGCITFRMICPAIESFPETADDEGDESGKQTFEMFLANRHEVKRNEKIRKAAVKHLLIPPVRSHSDQLSPSNWTVYGRFLREILVGSSHADKLAELITEATTQLRDLLQTEAGQLTRTAKATSYVDAINFQLTKEGDPIELLRNLSLAVTYKGRTEDISQVGTGTQSAVIIGVLELCLRHRASRGLSFFAVEEPELFLHPHAQRYVAELLRAIAEEKRSQVILTTHSACILADTDIRDVIRIERDEYGHTSSRRVPTGYSGLDSCQRILNTETCEMMFADRVALVEGPSEAIFLPGVSKALAKREESPSFSFDYQNVSVVDVGGKDFFTPYAELLTQFGIEWRIVTDRDALRGDTLKPFKIKAGLKGTEKDDEQINRLREVDIGVLSYGEIEDYYPDEALAEITGCAVESVQDEKSQRRIIFDEPSTFTVITSIIREHRQAMCEADDTRLEKMTKRAYDQTLQRIRDQGELDTSTAKTGDVISRWLKLSKPIIALRVSQWLGKHPDKIPSSLQELIKWILTDRGDNNACI